MSGYDCIASFALFFRRFLLCLPPSSVLTTLLSNPSSSPSSALFLFLFTCLSCSVIEPFIDSPPFTFLLSFLVGRASSTFSFFLTLSGFGAFGPFFFLCRGSAMPLGGTRARSGAVGWRACSSDYASCMLQRDQRLRDSGRGRTVSFILSVISLTGSRTITERLTWTIGTAGIIRNFARKGCDCVATT